MLGKPNKKAATNIFFIQTPLLSYIEQVGHFAKPHPHSILQKWLNFPFNTRKQKVLRGDENDER